MGRRPIFSLVQGKNVCIITFFVHGPCKKGEISYYAHSKNNSKPGINV